MFDYLNDIVSKANDKSSAKLRILSYVIILMGASWLGSVIFLFDKSLMPTTTFVGMIASFLGLDVAKILKSTHNSPKNEFRKIRKFRYIFCLFVLLVLYAMCLTVKDHKDIVDTASMLTNGAFAIMGLFFAALGGNRVLTKRSEKNVTTASADKSKF